MMRFKVVALVAALVLVTAFAASGMKEQGRPLPPPDGAVGRIPMAAPFVILQAGDTTWLQVHTSELKCPGDPLGGHGGEATGGPDGSETWCFEYWQGGVGVGDSCGTNPPWDAPPGCIEHLDVRALPSQVGVNYWHVSDYRTDQRSYCGDSALWCGSASLWQGLPVECGTWVNPPGYGDQWNCIAQLELPGSFDVANGCTLFFDPRYDTECKYDYFYVEFFDGTQWTELGLFNATSNNSGTECGTPTGGNPDHWGNTDENRLSKCNWQARSGAGTEPAFMAEISSASYSYTSAPKFRWRFESDGAWSDADGAGNTDGAAFIDNVWVWGDDEQYVMDFETGLDGYWTFPDPDGLIDQWHMVKDPDPPYEGGDGGSQTTCTLDSSIVYRGRPENGYPSGVPWRNGWYYRLVSPVIPLFDTGCVVQYDQFMCCKEITCDYTDTQVRFYNGTDDVWCPWINIDGFILYGGCFFWNFDRQEDVTPFYSGKNDSMQFSWELKDVSSEGDFCRGKHKGTENIIDNVSIGFFDGNSTVFRTRVIDLLQDQIFTDICLANSGFDAYDQDTLNWYADDAHSIPAGNQLYVEVTDKDYVTSVELIGSLDEGSNWVSVPMTLFDEFDPTDPDLGGEYYANFCPDDFSLAEWDPGTEIWYYVKCTDDLANEAYFPAEANPSSPDHTGTREDYFEVSILPMFPDTYEGIKILLVDGHGRRLYDFAPCFAADDNLMPLEDIYEMTLRDAGYCYDKFDISGSGSNVHTHWLCTWNTEYDAVVWFTGPYFSNYLFDADAQRAFEDYLAAGGKLILAGDRIAYNATPEPDGAGEDSLAGRLLTGILGVEWDAEMASGFDDPYIYAKGVASVSVFGTPTAVDFDTVLVYRQCPYLKDMTWIKIQPTPPAGYDVQPLLQVTYPVRAGALMATYVEYQDVGQVVFLNYDQSGSINHNYQFCTGAVPVGYPAFTPGYYEGRVDLFYMILNDLFGLPSNGKGQGGGVGAPDATAIKWALNQNYPNPVSSSTEVRYQVARASDVSIKVYNAMGQLVQTLADGHMEPGSYTARWDAKNLAGEKVSSGVYFYKMNAGGFRATKKMLVVR